MKFYTLAEAAKIVGIDVNNIKRRKTAIFDVNDKDELLVAVEEDGRDLVRRTEEVPYTIEKDGKTYYNVRQYSKKHGVTGSGNSRIVDSFRQKFNGLWYSYAIFDYSNPEVDGEELVPLCEFKEEAKTEGYRMAKKLEGPLVKYRNKWYGAKEKIKEFVAMRAISPFFRKEYKIDGIDVLTLDERQSIVDTLTQCVKLGVDDLTVLGKTINNLFSHKDNVRKIKEGVMQAVQWRNHSIESLKAMFGDRYKWLKRQLSFAGNLDLTDGLENLKKFSCSPTRNAFIREVFETLKVIFKADSAECNVESYTSLLFPSAKFAMSPEYILNRGIFDEDLSAPSEYLDYLATLDLEDEE